MQTKTTLKTAMHLAIKIGKPERALILLTETKGNWPEIISASLTSWYNFIGQGIERRDSTSSNVIHYAIQHKIQPVLFKQLLDLGKMSGKIQQYVNLLELGK